ncbi:unnamed protein product [Spirodela intermedia]|uniref:Uncharacterized protein n=1 Tax=Spirodela intermedia TaxID=51605 RepID=A0A7I8JNG2_SPIIN|nr:unnamed protein product [Spirodela intermedia]CAA6671679.1 unnamed protein product [Spirodela intermedia]
MERWVPLFQIFLHSPCPEGEASLWFQQQQQQQQQPPPGHHVTSAFLSLLEAPTAAVSRSTPSLLFHSLPWPSQLVDRFLFLLLHLKVRVDADAPPAVQSQVLSFLAMESRRFCRRRLRSLARHILEDEASGARHNGSTPGFWRLPATSHEETGEEGGGEEMEEDFDSVPAWLSSVTAVESPLLPWLPLSLHQIHELGRRSQIEMSAGEQAGAHYPDLQILNPGTSERALSLKAKILTVASSSDALLMASEIQALCFSHGEAENQRPLEVLSLMEPWQAEDEMASVLLSHLSSSCSLGNPHASGLLLASVVLPKLMVLQSPASRVLLSTTVDFCKLHQVAATNALFLPLILLKEGINSHLCDLLSKIVRECLHPSHVSACCQKLLRGATLKEEIICLPSHQSLISDYPVWTESLFSLFQQILTRGVLLTPDAVDRLVSVVDDSASAHRKSLKFCNFLLCMISRCPRAVKCHKTSLMRTAERTDTFVTKSILSKLGSQ